MKRKPLLFSVCYLTLLTMFTAWILLDQFVIVRTYSVDPPVTVAPVTEAPIGDEPITEELQTEEPVPAETEPPFETVITDRSYICEEFSIIITEERYLETTLYIAEVILTSPDQLKAAFAFNTYGRNVKDTVQNTAEAVNAVFAVNGDYYGYRKSGYVIRNGVLYRDSVYSATQEALIIGYDGTLSSVYEKNVPAQQLLDEGAMHVLSFGPTLIQDGQILNNNLESRDKKANPRCAVGMIEPLHYIFVVANGRTSEDRGLTTLELARVFQKFGCSFAYNLDGGGSATMVFMGNVLNDPRSGKGEAKEREVSDIVYIGAP